MSDHELDSSGGNGRSRDDGQSQGEDHSLSSQSDENPASSPPSLLDDDSDLGDALRIIYQQTVDEDIPSEMLDLLNRLD